MNSQASSSQSKPMIIDGGIGSEIRARGYVLHESAWSALAHVERPDLVMGIHRDYLAAGAEIVTANTFSLSRHNLEHAGMGDSFVTANAGAVKIARAAVDSEPDRRALVAGSMSTIPPMDYPDRLETGMRAFENYRDQAQILADNGADLIAAEMLLEAESASALLEAALTVNLPVWAGLSAMLGGGQTIMGFRAPGKYLAVPETKFSDLVNAVAKFDVSMIAVMHTKIDVISAALSEIRGTWDGQIAAYAETGRSGDSDWFFDTAASPEDYADIAAQWVDRFELDAVGGCCGTRPAHVAALSKRLK